MNGSPNNELDGCRLCVGRNHDKIRGRNPTGSTTLSHQ
jgi:hypothetical protein